MGMEGVLVMWGSIILIAGSIALLDWWSRRKDRQSKDRAA